MLRHNRVVGRSRQRRRWWATPWGATGLFALSAGLVAYPAVWTFIGATFAWTGCGGQCGPPNRWGGGLLFILLAALIALPFGVLSAAWRRWLGWTVIGLVASLFSLVGYLFWAGIL